MEDSMQKLHKYYASSTCKTSYYPNKKGFCAFKKEYNTVQECTSHDSLSRCDLMQNKQSIFILCMECLAQYPAHSGHQRKTFVNE